jgi:hypothetical protein
MRTFARRVIGDDLQMVSAVPPSRTVWVTAWTPPSSESPEKIRKMIAENAHPARGRFMDRSDGGGRLAWRG